MDVKAELLLEDLLVSFQEMDEFNSAGDHNATLKKIHEGIQKIKSYKQQKGEANNE